MIAHKPFVTNHVLSSITLEKEGKGKRKEDKECQMATLLCSHDVLLRVEPRKHQYWESSRVKDNEA